MLKFAERILKLVLRDGLEPPSPDYKTGILAFEITEHNWHA